MEYPIGSLIGGFFTESSAKPLHERKVVHQTQKYLVTEAIKELRAKDKMSPLDKQRLAHLEAQLEQIDKFEKWGV